MNEETTVESPVPILPSISHIDEHEKMSNGEWCVVCTLSFVSAHGRLTMCNWCRATGHKTKAYGAEPAVHPTVMDGEGTLDG